MSSSSFNTLSKALNFKTVILILLLVCIQIRAGGLFEPRVFSRDNTLFLVEPQRIVFLSMDTRTSCNLYSAVEEQFTITSAVQSGDIIWATNNIGAVMSISMKTSTVEEWGRGFAGITGGHIDVDRRFLWRASNDTLHRMELSSGEWISIPINKNAHNIHGVMSFNDQIHIISSEAVHIFRTASEDWTTVPHGKFTLNSGDFRVFENTGFFIQGNTFYRYDPAKRLWNRSALRDSIRSVDFSRNAITIAAQNRTYNFSPNAFTLEPHASIPMLRGIRSIMSYYNRTVCALDKGLALFYTKDMALSRSSFDFDFVQYPEHIRLGENAFIFTHDNNFIIYTNNNFLIHHPERRLWSIVKIINRNNAQSDTRGLRDEEEMRVYRSKKDNSGINGWNENSETTVHSTENYRSTLHGRIGIGNNTEAYRSKGSSTEFTLIDIERGNTTLNLHTKDSDGRFLDITIDNGAATEWRSEAGLYYKGAEGDRIKSASFGVQNSGLASSQLTPDFLSQGVNATFASKTKTENRDRSFVTAGAGGGRVISKILWESSGYRPSAIYPLRERESLEIIPASVKMYIDGVELSGTDYRYDPALSSVRLLRRDKADPASIIQICYSVKMLSDLDNFELFQEDHFGRYSYMESSVSPRSWLSARAGVMSIDRANSIPWGNTWNAPEVNTVILAGAPVEWRDANANRSLLVYPEIAYDNIWGAHSGGVSVGVRENRAFGSYRGFWAGRDYWGIDQPHFTPPYSINDSRAMIREEHDIDFGYDLRDDFRVAWRQMHRDNAQDTSSISMYELRSLYTGNFLPDVEMSVSKRFFDKNYDMPTRERKETFNLRISDMSSTYLNRVSGMHNIGYDFSFTEYWTNDEQNGSTMYGWGSVSPTNKLTLAGSGMYRINPSNYHISRETAPSITINTRDLPAGFDIEGIYSAHHSEISNNGGNEFIVERGISGFFYPGTYSGALDKFALYLGCDQRIETRDTLSGSFTKYAFVSDKNSLARSTESAGLLFFPAGNLLLSAVNSRTRWQVYSSGFDQADYSTSERAKYWFESGSSVEANFRAQKRNGYDPLDLSASSIYEHRWKNGLLTGIEMYGERYSPNDSTTFLCGGPRFIISETKVLSGFIRSRETSHLLGITAYNDERHSNVNYSFHLRLKMPPDIALTGDLSVAYYGQNKETKAWARLYLYAGF
ncbi:MAG: hypothetical protein LBI42_02005 [Chitinispirillales bacterium]|jgi:hypothetical protein|nr:hypothetical protein [Chitinispirillales bacterium]